MQKVIMLQYFQRLFLQLPTLCWLQNKKAFVLAVVQKCLTICRIKTKDFQKVDGVSALKQTQSIKQAFALNPWYLSQHIHFEAFHHYSHMV